MRCPLWQLGSAIPRQRAEHQQSLFGSAESAVCRSRELTCILDLFSDPCGGGDADDWSECSIGLSGITEFILFGQFCELLDEIVVLG